LGQQVADLLIQEVGPVPQSTTILSSVNDVEEFVAGLFKGLVDKDDLNNIKQCMKDAGTLDGELQTAISDFEKKDIPDIIAGAKVVGQMVTQLSSDLSDCKSMSADVARVEKWAAIFKDPKALEKLMFQNTLMHIGAIKVDIQNISGDVQSKNYMDMGQQVADLLIQEVGPVPQLGLNPALTEALEITKGVLMGAIEAEGLDNIDHCITGVNPIIQDVEVAISDFKKKDAASVLAGLKELGSAVTLMKSELQYCEGVKGDWEKLVKMVSIFNSPASFVYHVGKDLILNGRQIYNDVDDSITKYDSKSYEAFGHDIGDALAKLLIGDAQKEQEELYQHWADQGLNLYWI